MSVPTAVQIGYVNSTSLGAARATGTSFPKLVSTLSLGIGTYIIQAHGMFNTSSGSKS